MWNLQSALSLLALCDKQAFEPHLFLQRVPFLLAAEPAHLYGLTKQPTQPETNLLCKYAGHLPQSLYNSLLKSLKGYCPILSSRDLCT